MIYDSGDYHSSLDKLLEHVDVAAFRDEQAKLREQGIYRGIGFCTWTEICGLAPSRITGPAASACRPGCGSRRWSASTTPARSPSTRGTSPHGQGLDTAFAQIVADRLGVDPAVVEVIHGDTSMGPEGRNTYGSRSLATGGEAIVKAADKVVEKAKAIVAAELEAAPEDIEVADGRFQVKGSPDKGMALADVAGIAYIGAVPEGMEPGLEETTFYDPENFVFPFGAHACIVDVDPETGKTTVVRYVAVDDCGNPVNPMLIDGQIHGGVVHGIGQALYEQVAYDDEGQLVTRHVRRLRAADRRRDAELRDRPHGDAVAGQLDGRQGRRRGRDDRRLGGVTNAVIDALAPARRRLHEHAAQPDAGVGGDRRRRRSQRRPTDDPGRVRLRRARVARRRDQGARRRRRGRQAARGRPLADPADEAAAGGAVAARRSAQAARAARRPAPERRLADRRDDDPRGCSSMLPELGVVSDVAATIADPQVRHRGTIGGSLAHGDSASDLPAAMLICEAEVTLQGPSGQRTVAAADLFQDYLTTALAEDEVLTEIRVPALDGYGHALPEVHATGRGLGDGRGLRRRQGR